MNIVIIGGVAAGMSAAARMRRIDESANIVVLEAGNYVSFANCGLPYHLAGEIEERDDLLLHTPASLRERANLDVRINTSAIRINREDKTVDVEGPNGSESVPYDKLLITTGAAPIVPNIKGADHPAVSTLRTVPELDGLIERAQSAIEKAKVAGRKPRAAVLGAGFIGLETVEALVHRGFEVDLIDLADHVLPPLDVDLSLYLGDELEARGVRLHLNAAAESISDVKDARSNSAADSFTVRPAEQEASPEDGAVVIGLSTGESVRADVVVMSVGVRPNSELAKEAGLDLTERGAVVVGSDLRTSDPHIWAAGDVIEVPFSWGESGSVMLAGPANRQGRTVADAMLGRSVSAQPPVLRTAVVRVFDQYAAVTGATRRELDANGTNYEVVRIHAAHHAGYYPGAETVHILGFFDVDSKKLLGAQAVGKAGVDKRIDVLATAIRAGMTAGDIAQLELTYSPPVGAAKDPVNMLGFVAENVLDGFAPQWQPDKLDKARERGKILDVRNPGEVAQWSLSDSLNVPLPELRDRIDEVREWAGNDYVFVHCASGVRSYLAQRILVNSGIEAFNIAGGATSLRTAERLGQFAR